MKRTINEIYQLLKEKEENALNDLTSEVLNKWNH